MSNAAKREDCKCKAIKKESIKKREGNHESWKIYLERLLNMESINQIGYDKKIYWGKKRKNVERNDKKGRIYRNHTNVEKGAKPQDMVI